MAISVPALLDSAQTYASAADSSNEAINLLQIVDASHAYTSGYTRRNYYDSAGQLPTADSSMEGMITLVKHENAAGGNGLYLCTGTAWTEFYDLDSGEYAVFSLQGSTSGFIAGGNLFPPSSPSITSAIGKFDFSSSVTFTDHGDLSAERGNTIHTGTQSATHGFSHGTTPTGGITKFSLTTNTTSTDVATLTYARNYMRSWSSPSDYGYIYGGRGQTYSGDVNPGQATPPSTTGQEIQKFAHASSNPSSDIGDMVVNTEAGVPNNSTEYGYNYNGGLSPWYPTGSPTNFVPPHSGGKLGPSGPSWGPGSYNIYPGSPGVIYIAHDARDKMPFASDTNSSWISNSGTYAYEGAGMNSSDTGYIYGGSVPNLQALSLRRIDKFPFASDTTITSHGNIDYPGSPQFTYVTMGISSTDYGYAAGGITANYPAPSWNYTRNVVRFPFATGSQEADVGDISPTYAVSYGSTFHK
jgi:hypothetical protein